MGTDCPGECSCGDLKHAFASLVWLVQFYSCLKYKCLLHANILAQSLGRQLLAAYYQDILTFLVRSCLGSSLEAPVKSILGQCSQSDQW